MKLKKFFALALAAATLALALTACGSKAGDSADNSDANTDNQTGETVTVKLGVVGGIYDDLWASAKAALADEGIDLEIVQFSDYVTPNNALANGDIDLNAFQHRIYLQNEIDNYGYAIQNIGNTFIIPLNLYSQKVSSVDELKDGDVVAIPDDLTNGGRALKVLEAAGLIELDPNAAFNPTVDDITSYKVNITIEELKANTIPSVLPDVAAAVVNGNYALDFGLKTDEAIYKDSVLDVEEYWNLIAARTADIEDPDTGVVEYGHGCKIGYFAQEHDTLDLNATVLENLTHVAPELNDTQARSILGSFLFSGDDAFKPARVLSGGEKTRLALATLVTSRANVLLLDEPTNNLDPASRDEILKAIAKYEGAIVLVTHDEGAVQALNPERVLLMPDGDEDLWNDSYLDLVAEE